VLAQAVFLWAKDCSSLKDANVNSRWAAQPVGVLEFTTNFCSLLVLYNKKLHGRAEYSTKKLSIVQISTKKQKKCTFYSKFSAN